MRGLHVAASGVGLGIVAIALAWTAGAQSTSANIFVRNQTGGSSYLVSVVNKGAALESSERSEVSIELVDLVPPGVTVTHINAAQPWACAPLAPLPALPLTGPGAISCTFKVQVGSSIATSVLLPQITISFTGGPKNKSCVAGRLFRVEGGSTKLVTETNLNDNYACI